MSGVRLHPKFGVNPTIPLCFVCGKPRNEVALIGAASKTQMPMHAHIDRRPCEDCEKRIKDGGVWLIEVRDTDPDFRTGRIFCVKASAVEEVFGKKVPEGIAFINQETVKASGLEAVIPIGV